MFTPFFPTRALSFAIGAGVLLLAACDSGELSAPPDSQSVAMSPVDLSASMNKVDVCHRTTTGEYTKISIADAAYGTHMDHGDGGVFSPVPGNEAYVFDSDCQPIPLDFHCPCYPTLGDLGDLEGKGLPDYWTDGSGSWKYTLTSSTSQAEASVSYDGLNAACAITQSDGSGQTYSPIRTGDAQECIAVLQANGSILIE